MMTAPMRSRSRLLATAMAGIFLKNGGLGECSLEEMGGMRVSPFTQWMGEALFFVNIRAGAERDGARDGNSSGQFHGAYGARFHAADRPAATLFHSMRLGFLGSIAFSAACGLIYLLMKSEDYALMIGSVTAFGAIALTMYVTRKLDWYGGRDKA